MRHALIVAISGLLLIAGGLFFIHRDQTSEAIFWCITLAVIGVCGLIPEPKKEETHDADFQR